MEYLLWMGLRSTSAKLLNVIPVSNPHLTFTFEKRTENLLCIDSWLNAESLGGVNSDLNTVFQRGLTVDPNEGLMLTAGLIDLPKDTSSSSSSNDSERFKHQFLYCRVGIGRAFLTDSHTMATQSVTPPEGYDSLYLGPEENSNSNGEKDSHPLSSTKNDVPGYHHRYSIFDSTQILPYYLVQFSYDPEDDEKPVVVTCDVCEERAATVYCQQDDARLCAVCDTESHSVNKLVARHKRVPIQKQPKSFGFCEHHPDMKIEFFCPQCHVPVCVHCKMVGSHSGGEAAAHKLVPVSVAYQEALENANRTDMILENRKQLIRSQVGVLEVRSKEVEKNAAHAEKELYRILEQALFRLQSIRRRKKNVLRGDLLELRRQLEQIAQTESFIRYNEKYMGPVEFLNAWSRHADVRDELHHFAHFRDEVDVQADIVLQGIVDVTTQGDQETAYLQDGAQNFGETGYGFGDMQGGAPQGAPGFRAQLFGDRFAQDTLMEDGTHNHGGAGAAGGGPFNMSQRAPLDYSAGGQYVGGANYSQEMHSPYVKTTDEVWNESLRAQRDRKHADQVERATEHGNPAGEETPMSPNNHSHSVQEIMTAMDATIRRVEQPAMGGVAPSSLTAQSDSKRRTMASEALSPVGHVFGMSRILSRTDSQTLYFALPGCGDLEPRLLFATWKDGRNMAKLHALVDANGPTTILLKVGARAFGGFAATPWNSKGVRFGTPKSFLFSIDQDMVLPYHGKGEQACCLFGSPASISFGTQDLVVADNFASCSSQLESAYGIGLSEEEAGKFLAGSTQFVPDEVEVWKTF